jgi:hypothetical protein
MWSEKLQASLVHARASAQVSLQALSFLHFQSAFRNESTWLSKQSLVVVCEVGAGINGRTGGDDPVVEGERLPPNSLATRHGPAVQTATFIDHSCQVRKFLNLHALVADFAALLLKGGRFA